MKQLLEAFLELDTLTGIFLICGSVGFVAMVALIVSRISFRAGQRSARQCASRFTTKRRELASIGG